MSRRSELKKDILKHLLFHGKATRPELVALTGIRAATVFEAIGELKDEHLVSEPERRGKRTGRRAPELSIAPGSCWSVGVELRPDCCIGVVVDACGNVMFQAETDAEFRDSLDGVKQEIMLLLQMLREMAGDSWRMVRGLGFADPGLVDVARRYSIRAVNVPGWQELDTGSYLEGYKLYLDTIEFRQNVINLIDDRVNNFNEYAGLKFGSMEGSNNEAGNWE